MALSLDGVFQFFSEPDGLETAVTSYLSIDGRCDISKFFSRFVTTFVLKVGANHYLYSVLIR